MPSPPSSPTQAQKITLPVAPRAFARGRFVPSTPGAPPLPAAVPPAMALKWLDQQLALNPALAQVDLYGPGDPLAELGPTLETLSLLRERFPALQLSLSTLGLGGAEHASVLGAHKVRQVTLLVDALDPVVLQQIYSWIRPGKHTMPLAQAAVLLPEEQQRAVPALTAAGCAVAIAVTVYPGINGGEVEGIARRMAALGATSMILAPGRVTVEDDPTASVTPDATLLERLAEDARRHLASVAVEETHHGTLAPDLGSTTPVAAANLPRASAQRPNVAVASSNGMDIDLHLGQALQLLIYGPREDGLPCLLTTRPAASGSGTPRWEALAETLTDCFAILATSAGDNPRKVLGEQGIAVLQTEGDVAATVDVLFGGGKKGKGCKKG